MSEVILKPTDISPIQAKNVIAFLNNAKTADEIAAAVEIDNETDVGITVAQRIVDVRNKLGGFTHIDQLSNVPGVGQERFSEIVTCLGGSFFVPPEESKIVDTDTFITKCGESFTPLVLAKETRITMKIKNTNESDVKNCSIKVELSGGGSGSDSSREAELDPGEGATIRLDAANTITITCLGNDPTDGCTGKYTITEG